MDGYATSFVVPNLTLAGMQAGSDLKTETPRGLDHGGGAPDGASRSVKGGQESGVGSFETPYLLSRPLLRRLRQDSNLPASAPEGGLLLETVFSAQPNRCEPAV